MNLSDFTPPILKKILNKISRSLGIGDLRKGPFRQLPKEITPLLILDVGANIGDTALAALKSYPNCKVICFEPVAESYNKLLTRLKRFTGRATFIKKALSDSNGFCEINITSFHGANSIEKQSDFHRKSNPHVTEIKKETIEVVKLDDYINEFNNQKVDILKIDVEGHELKVLRGGIDFITQYVDTIIIECSMMRDQSWSEQSITEIFNLLNKTGFRLINIFDVHHSPGEVDPNLLCVQFDCVFRHISSLNKKS